MEVSLLLMQQIAQLFIVLIMGYAVVKAGLLKASDSKVLSVVFVYLVMPCVVLNAFQIDDTPQIRTGLLYSMGIAVGMHFVFLVLNAIFKRPLKLDVVEQVNIHIQQCGCARHPSGSGFARRGICRVFLCFRHRSADSSLDTRKCLPARRRKTRMEEDSHQCQPDCDCRRCALVPSAYLAALACRKHTQQRRCYDRTYGYAAGRYGDCRSAVKESLLYTAQLSSRCTSSDCSSYHCSATTSRVPRI